MLHAYACLTAMISKTKSTRPPAAASTLLPTAVCFSLPPTTSCEVTVMAKFAACYLQLPDLNVATKHRADRSGVNKDECLINFQKIKKRNLPLC